MPIRKRGGDSQDSPSLRETRIEQRRNYTDACTNKGADDEGIRRGTNAIYRVVGRPEGSRDEWSEHEQKTIAITENFAANQVRALPDSDLSQTQANDRVVEASSQGARSAQDYIQDQADNGNWWSRLFP